MGDIRQLLNDLDFDLIQTVSHPVERDNRSGNLFIPHVAHPVDALEIKLVNAVLYPTKRDEGGSYGRKFICQV